jgi:hypothetical protein
MKKLIFVLAFLASSLSYANFDEGKSALLVNFGFTQGGMALGLDYEYGADSTYGLGAYFRMYPQDDNVATGVTALGAFIRPHFNRQAWDFYLSPGFGFFEVEPATPNGESESMIGPSLALGLLYELNSQISVGIEQMSFTGWFGEDQYRGQRYEETLAKFRFIF